MISAAGIMFITPAKEVLFLKRGPGGDWPGAFCFPGGTTDEDETAEQTAVREAKEELGFCPGGKRVLWTRRIANREIAGPNAPNTGLPPTDPLVIPGDPVDYTTFIQAVPNRFDPKLNGEHTGFAWCKASEPPEPLHPGARIALDRLTMNELDVARAMAAGDLTSPQRVGTFWLWNIRITGTGLAFRGAHKDKKGKVLREEEFCWRDKSIYLTDDFLARCNGLPVIFEHPGKAPTLDSAEFNERIVGTTFLPFIREDDVWAVAKIYDESTHEMMRMGEASTSPNVIMDDEAGEFLRMGDGSALLIEGKPALLDHIAVLVNGDLGVWDKGGPPSGVQNDMLASVKKDAATTTRNETIAGILATVVGLNATVNRLSHRINQ